MTDEQLMELFGAVPHFADYSILPFDASRHAINQEYMTSFYNAYEASINLLEVCGTVHPNYAGLTWREFLVKGHRMAENLRAFQDNPSYYTAILQRLPNMHYLKADGNIYVTEDGNHRTCIGKFFLYGRTNPYIHGVHLVEEEYDHFFRGQVEAIRNEATRNIATRDCQVDVVKTSVHREDGPGWYRDFFNLGVEIKRAGDSGCIFSATRQELAEIQDPRELFRFVSKNVQQRELAS